MLTIQFIPYKEIEKLSSQKRVSKIIKNCKENKIVLLEGRLKKEEEAQLIQSAMENISETFKGIEPVVIYPEDNSKDFVSKIKIKFANFILGDRTGMTLVGPSSIVKEIKKDPEKIQLFLNNKLATTNKKPRKKKR